VDPMRVIWRHRLISRLANPGDRLVYAYMCTCIYFSNRLISLYIALLGDLLTTQIDIFRLRDGEVITSQHC